MAAVVIGVVVVPTAAAVVLFQHIGFQVNSTNQRTLYMRFLRKMTTKTIKSLAPELVERFQSKSGRAELFKDFFTADGNVEGMKVLHKRRHVDQQRSQKWRPLTQKQLEEKYDTEYAQNLIQDAVTNNRWKVDDLMPWDQERIKYYVLDDESIEFNQLYEQELSLAGSADVTSGQVAALSSAGCAFDSVAGHVGTLGFDNNAMARVMAGAPHVPAVVAEVPKPVRGQKNGKHAQQTVGEDGGDNVEVVAVVQPLEVQHKNCTVLTKLSGAACEMILRLKAMPENAEGWIKSIEDSKEKMEELYGELSTMTAKKVNDEELYVPCQERFDAVVDEYNNRKQFVNAFLNVKKRQEQAIS